MKLHGIVLAVCFAVAAAQPVFTQKVLLDTSAGEIVLELDEEKAPKTVANFIAYVTDGFYDGLVFHRVIDDFMIQGGGMSPEMAEKPTRPPVMNEADNGLKNKKGTIAMARTRDPHSASAQFFINLKDNPHLDHKAKTAMGWGYCVFGKVVKGMDVVEKIGKTPTGQFKGYRDVPKNPIVIKSARRVSE